jgi:hypothetical protein
VAVELPRLVAAAAPDWGCYILECHSDHGQHQALLLLEVGRAASSDGALAMLCPTLNDSVSLMPSVGMVCATVPSARSRSRSRSGPVK